MMKRYKGLHVFVFVWLVSCCVADWTPVKNSAEKAAEAQQVIQEQLHNYYNYMNTFRLERFLYEFLEDPLLRHKNGSIARSLCVNQTVDLIEDLLTGKPWAIQVLDAFGKPQTGLLKRNIQWRGSFKECTETVIKGNHTFKGQYCTAHLMNRTTSNRTQLGGSMNMMAMLQLGICVADSCSNDQVQVLMDKGLSLFGFDLVSNVSCQPESTVYDAPAIGVICLLSILGFVLLVATMYDIWVYQPYLIEAEKRAEDLAVTLMDEQSGEDSPLLGKKKRQMTTRPAQPGIAVRLLLSFSMYTNGYKLLDTSNKGGVIPVIHGVRFLSLTWVILGHSFIFGVMSISNFLDLIHEGQRWYFQILLNGTVAVDTFFLLSGLLVSYLLLRKLGEEEKPWKHNWLMYYFHRFWRLTPAYMLVLGTYTALFQYWGSGPAWPDHSIDRDQCDKYWWRNLFYIQNLWSSSEMCIAWSWYLAIDMQYFIISPLLIIPGCVAINRTRNKWFGVLVGACCTGVFLLIQIIVTIVTVVNNRSPSGIAAIIGDFVTGHMDVLNNMGNFMDDYYFKPWTRFGPYGVGVIAGYIMYATNRKIKMHWAVVVLGWSTAEVVALAVVFGTYEPAQGNLMSQSDSAAYNAFHSTAWGAAVAWVIIACDSGYGGFVNRFLCWKAFVPLSRLTYMAYLIHPIIMIWFYAGQQGMLFYSGLNFFYLYLGHLVMSYSIASIVSLAFESPMMGLEKVIFNRERTA